MKTDSRIGGGSSARHYRHPLVHCINRFLECLRDTPDPTAKRKVWWTPFKAAVAAVLMALDRGCSLAVRFEDARACMATDFRRGPRAGGTYNGFVKALERHAEAILPRLRADLQRRGETRLSRLRKGSRWLVLAVDGSKEDLPRTRDHEKHFGIADNGASPQSLITTIVEVTTGLLWDWRIDRARGSERHHLLEMAADLPEDALLLGDGAYIGFPVWSRLNELDQPFLIRVGGNVHLLTCLWPKAEARDKGDIVYVWPTVQRRKNHPPLMLRLIKVGSGRKAVHLLTNVLNPKELSRKDAGEIYRRRWGAELFFRTLKRSLGCAKLHSRASRRARMEMAWTLMALMITTMLGLDAAGRRRIEPARLSPAHLIHTLRTSLLRQSRPSRRGRTELSAALVAQLKDAYQRQYSKQSRHTPVTKNTPRPRIPQAPKKRRATCQERQIAKQFHEQMDA